MNLWKLAARGLVFHRRSHLGTLAGATVAAAILVGALAVGDSVRYSLRELALSRLGSVQLALNSQDKFFRTAIADGMSADLGAPTTAALNLRGTAASGDGTSRIGGVQLLGVESRFWTMSPDRGTHAPSQVDESVVLGENLARALHVRVGEDVLLRVDKPSLLSRDAPLSTIEDASISLRLPVRDVVDDSRFGRFSMAANQVAPYNVFLPIALLQRKLGIENRANLLLVGGSGARSITPEAATRALWKQWKLTDSGLELRSVLDGREVELRTERVFLDPPVAETALRAFPGATGILTYFVNGLSANGRTTPYSTVTAVNASPVPADLAESEIVVNQWIADDLGAKAGDSIKLDYWVVGSMRKLIPRTSSFRIRSVVPMSGDAADRDLMPNIPGLADKKDCRDWEPGVPIDLHKIRDKDQAYWSAYRGTPKAFVTLRAGQRMWDNRFGNLTAIRYVSGVNPAQTITNIELCLRQSLNPPALGLFFLPVRDQALKASFQSMDFGMLFLGFSMFLIAAALILTALLFAFGVEQRSQEVGTLLAVGWTPRKVQRMLLTEGALVAATAALCGAALAALYTRAVIGALTTVWRGAVAGTALRYHVEPQTLAIGAMAGFAAALFSIWLVCRRQAGKPARVLLSQGLDTEQLVESSAARTRLRGTGIPTTIAGIGLAIVTTAAALSTDRQSGAEYFFMAGALFLIGGVALCRVLLARAGRSIHAHRLTITSLGTRNTVRRRGRSLSAIGLLACGSFLVVAIGASREDTAADALKRSSGTGGFTVFGESSLPVYQDLNAVDGLDSFGLKREDLHGSVIVPMRLKEGDDASCLNLNRAQSPRILSVNPAHLAERKAFTFAEVWKGAGEAKSWELLSNALKSGEVPVIGDTNTVTWSLGKAVGDALDYTDDRGATRRLRIVGVISNSILQGSLIMSEENFIKLFPSHSGYQVFLIDSPPTESAQVSKTLTKGLEEVGLSMIPAADRLAAFSTVENTYLSIFAILGGLGLVLGSFGLGVIVLRNVLERRAELALLRAVGFRREKLQWMVFSEHVLLLALGLAVGLVSAIVAVIPTLRTPGIDAPYGSLAITLLAVLLCGFAWTWAASAIALRGRLLTALRNE